MSLASKDPSFRTGVLNAQHSGASSALARLDMTMPGRTFPLSGASFWGANLTIAVLNGIMPGCRLDDLCMRILVALYKAGGDTVSVHVNFDSFSTERTI